MNAKTGILASMAAALLGGKDAAKAYYDTTTGSNAKGDFTGALVQHKKNVAKRRKNRNPKK